MKVLAVHPVGLMDTKELLYMYAARGRESRAIDEASERFVRDSGDS